MAPVVNRIDGRALRRDRNRGNPTGRPLRFPLPGVAPVLEGAGQGVQAGVERLLRHLPPPRSRRCPWRRSSPSAARTASSSTTGSGRRPGCRRCVLRPAGRGCLHACQTPVERHPGCPRDPAQVDRRPCPGRPRDPHQPVPGCRARWRPRTGPYAPWPPSPRRSRLTLCPTGTRWTRPPRRTCPASHGLRQRSWVAVGGSSPTWRGGPPGAAEPLSGWPSPRAGAAAPGAVLPAGRCGPRRGGRPGPRSEPAARPRRPRGSCSAPAPNPTRHLMPSASA